MDDSTARTPGRHRSTARRYGLSAAAGWVWTVGGIVWLGLAAGAALAAHALAAVAPVAWVWP